MHNALLISEVLGYIVDHLAEGTTLLSPGLYPPQDYDKAGRQALAVLARTCRAFSEPALDAVWRRLYSLKPFIRCLPTKSSYEDTTADTALPAFDEAEWNIVLRYAPRVQELTLNHDQLSVKILQSLWFRTTLLLPNLRKLYQWACGGYTALASIRLLLNPSLVHLDMWVDDSDPTIMAFLESYHTLCPNIKSLVLGHLGHSPQVSAAVSRAITRLPNLERLVCNGINEAALIHVTQSHRLKKLSTSLLNHQPDTLRRLAGYGTPNHPPFKNLRILGRLEIEDLSSITPYLTSQHQPFEEVDFFLQMPHAAELFDGSYFPPPIILDVGYSPSLSTFQVLSPLVTLNLHVFSVVIPNPISLNDDEFAQLVQGWPELETLEFNQHSEHNYLPPLQFPTLRGLLLLLAQCPKLHGRVGLSVDARNIPQLSVDESLICNTTITELSLLNSPIQEPVTIVVHFLLKHLPSLTRISGPGWGILIGQPNYPRMWMKVDKEIKQIKQIVGGWRERIDALDSSEGTDST
ncbi:hypothetical protein JVT61DRAFT_166 [Boletus reticuloceps]|uniref:F-box domain-containing protein n=1 Tax=Boletus reticuloceps TaxID=495285 RepID=A0A8I2Z2P8_9AGAM|nr:hypothetical protein JVT61DRAFT_166 [Boletus reticuloceps]